MRHFVTYPMVAHPYSPELVSKQAIVRFATRAEELGFDGVGFTDHPAPSHRWLQAGGPRRARPVRGVRRWWRR